jgi:peptide/nickel transport system substrate-binding protein
MTSSGGYWATYAHARVSRRRALAAGAAGAGAVATIAAFGCGGKATKPAPSPDAGPRRGGTLRTGTTLPLAFGLDPHLETATGLAIFPRVYGYMLHVDPADDSVVYDQALSVEQPDAQTYIFKLREGVRFHDVPPINGRTVTSEDVALSIARYRDNPLVLNKTWHATALDKVEMPDATTVRITTSRPYVYSLAELGAVGAGAILPRELVTANADLSTAGVGSGPFRIDRASLADGVRLVRHEAYFREPLPYLDAMEWSIFASDDMKQAAFRQQQVDVVPNRDRIEAEGLAGDSADVEIASEPALAYLSLGLRTDRAPFTDPRVREAVDIALDRDAMIRDIAFGDGQVLGPVNPHLAEGNWSLPRAEIVASHRGDARIDARRADARSMLAQAGGGERAHPAAGAKDAAASRCRHGRSRPVAADRPHR